MGAIGRTASALWHSPPLVRLLELIVLSGGGIIAVAVGVGDSHFPPTSADPDWWRPVLYAVGMASALLFLYVMVCLAIWFVTETLRVGRLVLAHTPSHPMEAATTATPQTPEEVMATYRQPTRDAKVPIHYVGDGTRYLNGVPADPKVTLYVSKKAAEAYVAGGLYAIGAAPD